MNNQRLSITELNGILEDENALRKFLTYILIHKKKILPLNIIIKDKQYEDTNCVIKIENNIEDEIIIDIDCNGLGIRESDKGNLILSVDLSVKLIGGSEFCVTRIDTMVTGDGKAHYIKTHSIEEFENLTQIYTKEHFSNKIFKYL